MGKEHELLDSKRVKTDVISMSFWVFYLKKITNPQQNKETIMSLGLNFFFKYILDL